MKIPPRTLFAFLVLCFVAGCHNRSNTAVGPAAKLASARIANARDVDNVRAIPAPSGHFDYYLFTLSWAPEYCHGHRNSPECDGSHPGFVVHGLWPQYASGHWPSNCSSAPGLSNPASMLDIMPSPRLIAHEWTTHGTCTGLTAQQYFRTVRQAYNKIKIPAEFTNPSQTSRQSAAQVKQLFAAGNPGMSTDGMAVSCHNRYLSGVEFCLSKTLAPVACQMVRDCTAASIIVPSAR